MSNTELEDQTKKWARNPKAHVLTSKN